VVDGADLLHLVGNTLIALVEKQHADARGRRTPARCGNSRAPPTRMTGAGGLPSAPRSSRLADACTTLSSVIAALPSPLISAGRATGRPATRVVAAAAPAYMPPTKSMRAHNRVRVAGKSWRISGDRVSRLPGHQDIQLRVRHVDAEEAEFVRRQVAVIAATGNVRVTSSGDF
jgi:hypothetical protein